MFFTHLNLSVTIDGIQLNDFTTLADNQLLEFYDSYRYLKLGNEIFKYEHGTWRIKNIRHFTKTTTREYISIYKFKYNNAIKMYIVNGQLFGFSYLSRKTNPKNFIYYLRNPRLYIISKHIDSGAYSYEFSKKRVNIVPPLIDILKIPSINNLFITAKLDGITATIAFIKNHGLICIDRTKNILYEDKNFQVNRTHIFNGEYMNGTFYMYLEICNQSFKIDYKNIEKYIKLYGNTDIINKNIIIFPSNSIGDALRKIQVERTKRRLKTDGYIFGNISTKKHFKWKPTKDITNDFFIKLHNGTVYQYVGAKLNRELYERPLMQRNDSSHPIKNIYKRVSRNYGWVLFRIIDNADAKLWSKYDGYIVECYDDKPIRIRDTKHNPNNINTVESNIKLRKKNIKFEDLLKL